MDYKLLYKLIQETDKSTKINDIPKLVEDKINEISMEDVIGGVLGMYINKQLGDKLSIKDRGIAYTPNPHSTYGLSVKGGTPTISGQWRF